LGNSQIQEALILQQLYSIWESERQRKEKDLESEKGVRCWW